MDAFSKEDQSAILHRASNLTDQHRQYLADHPALTELLHDLLTNCMVNKPEDPFQFCRDYFYGLKGGDGVGDTVIGWGYKGKCKALLITGASGAGKKSAARQLEAKYPSHFGLAISHTSRPKRHGEKEGFDYVFTDREAISIAIQAGEFLCVTEVEGELYGVKKDRVSQVTSSGRVCVIACSKAGAMTIRRSMAGDLMPKTVYIHAKGSALKEHLHESLMKGAQFDVDERMTKAEAEWKALCEGPKGLFDLEIDIEYDGADQMMLSADCVGKLTGWCMEQDWEVKVDTDLDKAALKIQGQARRRRDAQRVKEMKGN